jgi:hypothetical protein
MSFSQSHIINIGCSDIMIYQPLSSLYQFEDTSGGTCAKMASKAPV